MSGNTEVEELRRQLETLKAENKKLKAALVADPENEELTEEEKVAKGRLVFGKLSKAHANKETYMVKAEEAYLDELAAAVGKECLDLVNALKGDEKGTPIKLHEDDLETLEKFPEAVKSMRNKNWFFAGMAGGTWIARLASSSSPFGLRAALGVAQIGFTIAEHYTKNRAEQLYEDALDLVKKAYERFEGVAKAALKFDQALKIFSKQGANKDMFLAQDIVDYCEQNRSQAVRFKSGQKALCMKIINAALLLSSTYDALLMLPFAVVQNALSVPFLDSVCDGFSSIGTILTGLCGTMSSEINQIAGHANNLRKQLKIMKDMVKDA